jgi:hypothetical protein
VCGDSNQSMDNICEKLVKMTQLYKLTEIKIVRWMSFKHIGGETYDQTIVPYIIPRTEDFEK